MTAQPNLPFSVSVHRGPRVIRNSLAAVGLLPAARRLKRGWLRLADPRQLPELDGERIAFTHLRRHGLLDAVTGGRVLEIGPKHGLDSRLLAALAPSELVLVDLPEKTPSIRSWLGEVDALCPARYEEGNILYMPAAARESLGLFNVVWCLGVVYHNVEQLRLLRRLYDLCADGGLVVVESSTARGRRARKANVVQLHWPLPFGGVPTITHLPSRRALASWLEMVGFVDVEIRDVYSRQVSKNRALLTARKAAGAPGLVSYGHSGLNPVYLPGEAT